MGWFGPHRRSVSRPWSCTLKVLMMRTINRAQASLNHLGASFQDNLEYHTSHSHIFPLASFFLISFLQNCRPGRCLTFS